MVRETRLVRVEFTFCPAGILSCTTDDQLTSVIELIAWIYRALRPSDAA